MSTSKHVVQSSCLGIWKAKEREVGSADNQSLARLAAGGSYHTGDKQPLPMVEMFQNAGRPRPSEDTSADTFNVYFCPDHLAVSVWDGCLDLNNPSIPQELRKQRTAQGPAAL